jgi:hypothetical protein
VLTALAYATENLPDAVKVQTVLDAACYRQIAQETGERLPGMEWLPEHETFRITFGKQEE